MGHAIGTLEDQLHDDPWWDIFFVPAWMRALINSGALGQKSGAGVYRKVGNEIQGLDLGKQDYRTARTTPAPEIEAVLKLENPAERLAMLHAQDHPQAQFL